MEQGQRTSGRQWGESLSEIRSDHVARYRWAAERVTGFVLDAACGCGYGSSILTESASGVVGVDLSPEAIKWACYYYPGPVYLVGDIQRGFLPGSQFDAVVSLETIEHLPNAYQALKTFARLSKTLIASVPNENVVAFRKEDHAHDEYPHVRHYTPSQLEDVLVDVGYTSFEWATQYGKDAKDVTDDKRDGHFILVHATR